MTAHGGDRRSSRAPIYHPGNRLWEYRMMRGITQCQLAEEIHLAQQTISGMESGAYKISDYANAWLSEHGG